jgi:hypothetical protein
MMCFSLIEEEFLDAIGGTPSAFWLLKREFMHALGAAPADRHAILDYLHQA